MMQILFIYLALFCALFSIVLISIKIQRMEKAIIATTNLIVTLSRSGAFGSEFKERLDLMLKDIQEIRCRALILN